MSTTIESLGPLTTTFTPSATCLTDLYRYAYGTELDFFHLNVDTSTSDCMPTGWNYNIGAYFSPGLCPSGYSIACSSTKAAETEAICCPSGYGCQTSTNLPWYSTNLCVSTMASTQAYVFYTVVVGKTKSLVSSTGSEGVNAFGVSIRYQSTDFVSSTTTTSGSATTTAAATATPTTTSAAVTSTGSSDGSKSSGGGLSSGAKAGIGIGVGVGGFIIIVLIAFLFFRRRRQARNVQAVPAIEDVQPTPSPPAPSPPADPYAYAQPPEQKYMQTVQSPIAEAPQYGRWNGPTELAELPTEPAELPAAR